MVRASQISKATKPTKTNNPTETCMVDQCKRPADTRGVCKSCYVHARVLVLSGETSWAELESMGLVMPAHKHAPKNPLKVAFLAALEKRETRKQVKKA
jgi:hypothetical protein